MCTELFKGRKEHPALHIDHAVFAIGFQHRFCNLHKYREQIALAFRIVLLHILTQHLIHFATPHVRRIRNHRRIPIRQRQNEAETLNQRFEILATLRLRFVASHPFL